MREIPTDPPRFRTRLVMPVASAITSLGTVATEKVVIGTNMEGIPNPLITIGQYPGSFVRTNRQAAGDVLQVY